MTKVEPPIRPVAGKDKEAVSRFVSRTRTNAWTVEVVDALRRRGIRAVLLKGPVIAHWLYAADPVARTYCDVDLLVSPDDRDQAEAALEQIGFSRPMHPEWLRTHARTWLRAADGANVDLHRTLHGMETISERLVWDEVLAGAEALVVAGVEVDILGLDMRALHTVMHLASYDTPQSKPTEDLRRALSQLDRPSWQRAAELARRLGVDDEMGCRLRMLPDGEALAGELGLPAVGKLWSYGRWAIVQGNQPGDIYPFVSFSSVRALSGRARWVVQRQFPSPDYMRFRYPVARKGRIGLAMSYLVRALDSAARLPGALRSWHSFNESLRGDLGSPDRPK